MDRRVSFIYNEHIAKPHRSGWGYVSHHLQELHNPFGPNFYSWLDRTLKVEERLDYPWTGVLHNPITYPATEYPMKYSGKVYPLVELVRKDWFHYSIQHCLGIFTLTKQTQEFLLGHIDKPVVHLWHPCVDFPQKFQGAKRVAHIGQWMRRYHSFAELETPRDKVMLKMDGFEWDYKEMSQYTDKPMKMTGPLVNEEYDDFLTSSIVFLDLYDVAACNTVLECIMTHTPLLINRVEGAVEYLGEDYPFFYQTLAEASCKLADESLICETNEYLAKMDKSRFHIDRFMNDLTQSEIYQSIARMKI